MRLDQLLGSVQGDLDLVGLAGDPATADVTGVTSSSTAVVPGALFCCLSGATADGHDFAGAAVVSGATALLCERPMPEPVPQVVVADSRRATALVAAAFHGHPSRRLAVVGVTGTNGKTTTTHLLRSVLAADGRRADVIGTLSGARTTPEATELQARLAALAAGGTEAVAMEVSSHALAQSRVDGVWFTVAVFTNLSQDHLDYHGTMEEYFRAKASLFAPERAAVAVVNADDEWGRRLLGAARVPTRPFSLADAADLTLGPDGATFRWDGAPVRLPLAGRFQVVNALAAATAARELGVPAARVADGLSTAGPVRGRFEPLDAGQPFRVVVDYAHTPAAMEEVLTAARQAAANGRVLLVFGCGGERDRAKRPVMGEVASRLADVAVVTSDNPRSEDPSAIIDEVRAGVGRVKALWVEPDRRAAIALVVADAEPGDVVVIAGKGHETTQALSTGPVPFDDRVVVQEELDRLSKVAKVNSDSTGGRGPAGEQADGTGRGGGPVSGRRRGRGPAGEQAW
ncbi:MAG: UDP-N-acetylmuramoyl-L-alanyl-D-glutamate--2,6-diaminopimelate ligase [Actinomycetota bacterium]|nr:UDP-N-acetylmuramoyl-L-alanyl-D-glutamate--2,6-diaminopimelate ligase [Actinomycetota bacterium]